MKKMRLLLLAAIGIVLWVACTPSAAPTPSPTTAPPPRPLVIGDISDEAAETIEGTQPLADYLAAQLEPFGITEGHVKIAPDLATMSHWMEEGAVDVYFDSPYPVLVVSQESGAEPVLRRLKYGVDEYYSVFFAAKDSDFQTVADLEGQVVAFEEAFSTSGYMLPLTHLLEEGYTPVEVASPQATVREGQVGYVFSTADNTTIQWVVSGLVPVGVVDNVTFRRLPTEIQAQLRIFAETEPVPRQMVLVSAHLEEELVEAVRQALLAMDENQEGQAALDVFLTTEFSEFPEGAVPALGRMRELYQLVQEIQ